MQGKTIAMIGYGNVGSALGRRLEGAGYRVVYGLRDSADEDAARSKVGPRAILAPLTRAVSEAEVVVIAVPGSVAVEAVSGLGRLAGKIVVDCTNPARWDGGPIWAPPDQGSNAAAIAALDTGAAVVKAFNAFGAEFHAEPHIRERGVDVPIAGDAADAKSTVADIARSAGFEPYDAGPLRNAALLENLAILWIHLATAGGRGRNFAFRLETRD